MAYRFKFREATSKGFRRIAREQIELALQELAAEPVSPQGVHNVRKALKRLKALLVTVAPVIDKKELRKRLAGLRDVGRLLSPQRDATVSLAAAQSLAEHCTADDADHINTVIGHVHHVAGEMSKSLDPAIAADTRARLTEEGKKLAKLRLKGRGFELLAEGVEVSYRSGRRAFKPAYKNPSEQAFHALRKSVQVHWRQMSLLTNAWPAVFEARVTEARELSQILGDDHDIAIMSKFLVDLADADQAKASHICDERQRALREAARFRVARLFAERPKAFKTRISEYWRTGAKISAQQRVKPPMAAQPADPAEPNDGTISIGSAPRLATKTPGGASRKVGADRLKSYRTPLR